MRAPVSTKTDEDTPIIVRANEYGCLGGRDGHRASPGNEPSQKCHRGVPWAIQRVEGHALLRAENHRTRVDMLP